MERVVDVSSDGLHLAVHRGFLTVRSDGEEQGRIALDDIGALIAHAHGLTWSNTVFVRMAERNVPVVICGPNHAPVSCLWPLDGHHRQGTRLRAQAAASLPLKKQLWQKTVSAKVAMQGAVLVSTGAEAGALEAMARRVRSGDPDNVEAQAARRYWPLLFGAGFRRDQNADGVNTLLNYGYTVLRAIVSRAICASGLHPTLGIHHHNQGNAFALADDLMEPYRPLVDCMVHGLASRGKDQLNPDTKARLAGIAMLDLEGEDGISSLSQHVQRFVHSVATSLETGKAMPAAPRPPSPLVLASLGTTDPDP